MQSCMAQIVSYPDFGRTDVATRSDLNSLGFGDIVMLILTLVLLAAFAHFHIKPRNHWDELEAQAMKFSHRKTNPK